MSVLSQFCLLTQAPFFFAQAFLGIFFPFYLQLTMTWNWNTWLNISFWIFVLKNWVNILCLQNSLFKLFSLDPLFFISSGPLAWKYIRNSNLTSALFFRKQKCCLTNWVVLKILKELKEQWPFCHFWVTLWDLKVRNNWRWALLLPVCLDHLVTLDLR